MSGRSSLAAFLTCITVLGGVTACSDTSKVTAEPTASAPASAAPTASEPAPTDSPSSSESPSADSFSSDSASPSEDPSPSEDASASEEPSPSRSYSSSTPSSSAASGLRTMVHGGKYSESNARKLATLLSSSAIPLSYSQANQTLSRPALALKSITVSPAACKPLARTADLYSMVPSVLAVAVDTERSIAVSLTVMPSSAPDITEVATKLKACKSYTVSTKSTEMTFSSKAKDPVVEDGITYYHSIVTGENLKGSAGYQIFAEKGRLRLTVSATDPSMTEDLLAEAAREIAPKVFSYGAKTA